MILAVGLSQKVEAENVDRLLIILSVMYSEDLLLPVEQREYIDTVMKNTEAKVILVLYSGCGAVDLSRN